MGTPPTHTPGARALLQLRGRTRALLQPRGPLTQGRAFFWGRGHPPGARALLLQPRDPLTQGPPPGVGSLLLGPDDKLCRGNMYNY